MAFLVDLAAFHRKPASSPMNHRVSSNETLLAIEAVERGEVEIMSIEKLRQLAQI